MAVGRPRTAHRRPGTPRRDAAVTPVWDTPFMPNARQYESKPLRSMWLAAWIFPVDLDGHQRESWSQWTNWRVFLLLLSGPVLVIGAFTARGSGVSWWERGGLAVTGAAISVILVRAVIGYRWLTASSRQRPKAQDTVSDR